VYVIYALGDDVNVETGSYIDVGMIIFVDTVEDKGVGVVIDVGMCDKGVEIGVDI
ncbi:hypothetical protein KI387_025574, partial [Taxus chinensis]